MIGAAGALLCVDKGSVGKTHGVALLLPRCVVETPVHPCAPAPWQMASMLSRYNTVKELAPTIDPASRPEVYVGVDVPAKEGGRVMMAERCGRVHVFVWCFPSVQRSETSPKSGVHS
jgi:hypothetical protein